MPAPQGDPAGRVQLRRARAVDVGGVARLLPAGRRAPPAVDRPAPRCAQIGLAGPGAERASTSSSTAASTRWRWRRTRARRRSPSGGSTSSGCRSTTSAARPSRCCWPSIRARRPSGSSRASLAIAPLVLVSYFTFKSSMGRLEDENRHLGEVNRLYLKVVETLAVAVDAKDQVTHGHIRRVQTTPSGSPTLLGVADERELRPSRPRRCCTTSASWPSRSTSSTSPAS